MKMMEAYALILRLVMSHDHGDDPILVSTAFLINACDILVLELGTGNMDNGALGSTA